MDRIDQVAVADPHDLEVEPVAVDRYDRDALLARARQDVVFAGEAHRRRAIADIDLVIGGFQQLLVGDRGGTPWRMTKA